MEIVLQAKIPISLPLSIIRPENKFSGLWKNNTFTPGLLFHTGIICRTIPLF